MPFPGVFPVGLFSGAPAPLTTLSQVASATSTAATVTGPASIQAGDLLVLWDTAQSGGGLPTSVVPSGFVSIVSVDDANIERNILSAKIADGSEANASLTGMDSVLERKSLYVFRGDIPITAYVANDIGSQNTVGDPTAQVCNASGGASPLVVIAGYRAQSAIDPRTFSPAKDGEITPATTQYLAYKIYNTSPADVTVDMDDEGTNQSLVSTYITCT